MGDHKRVDQIFVQQAHEVVVIPASGENKVAVYLALGIL
jgi:hypothetical protein